MVTRPVQGPWLKSSGPHRKCISCRNICERGQVHAASKRWYCLPCWDRGAPQAMNPPPGPPQTPRSDQYTHIGHGATISAPPGGSWLPAPPAAHGCSPPNYGMKDYINYSKHAK